MVRSVFALAGLPRYFKTNLPDLVSSIALVTDAPVHLCLWRTSPGNTAPSLSQISYAQSAEEWAFIETLPNTKLRKLDTKSHTSKKSWDDHPQVQLLQLRPNYAATMGWLSSLIQAIDFLDSENSGRDSELWILTRPDIKIWRLKRILERAQYVVNKQPGVVVTAARPRSHSVLNTAVSCRNLPIDHVLIGRPNEFLLLKKSLEKACREVESESYEAQPLVNEFLLGGALYDAGLAEAPMLIPYLVWRGSLWKSFTDFNSVGLNWIRTFIQNLEWAIIRFFQAGRLRTA